MTIVEEKQAQRTAARAARKTLDAPQRAAANAALSLLALEKLGLEVSIEDTARKKR